MLLSHIMRRAALLLVALLALAATVQAQSPRNVILFIGDGMGYEQVRAAALYSGEPLSFQSFPHRGAVTTHSANNPVTDSAAAGTAIATGRKVNDGVIGLATPGNGEPLETFLTYSQARGKKAGLVSTTYITHATPASFAAFQPSRNRFEQIARDYLTLTQPNVLLGGDQHIKKVMADIEHPYTVFTDLEELLTRSRTEPLDFVSGQFGNAEDGSIEYEEAAGHPQVLSRMTEAALNILGRHDEGFFLMVEGGKIDWAGHANHIVNNVYETLEFDRAVQAAMRWAGGRQDTLIVVTSDHETGGLRVRRPPADPGDMPTATWSSTGHTAVNVPVYAWGPRAHLVSGVMDNTEFFGVMTQQAFQPTPGPGSESVERAPILTWKAPRLSVAFDVYLGEDTLEYQGLVTDNIYYPDPLEPNTTYQWRVDARTPTGEVMQGEVWQFTTAARRARRPAPAQQ